MKNYTIKIASDISIIRFVYSPSINDVKASIDELSIKQPKLRLWDLCKGMNLSEDEIIEVAEYGKLKFTSPARIAIIAPSDLTFGLSRMHEVYREHCILVERVFRNESDALEWLKNENA